jgi:hypothetical protein
MHVNFDTADKFDARHRLIKKCRWHWWGTKFALLVYLCDGNQPGTERETGSWKILAHCPFKVIGNCYVLFITELVGRFTTTHHRYYNDDLEHLLACFSYFLCEGWATDDLNANVRDCKEYPTASTSVSQDYTCLYCLANSRDCRARLARDLK